MRLPVLGLIISLWMSPVLFSAESVPVLRKSVRPLGGKGPSAVCEIHVNDEGQATTHRIQVSERLKTSDTRSFAIAYGDIAAMIAECAALPPVKDRAVASYPAPNLRRITYEAKGTRWFTLGESSAVNEKTLRNESADELIGLLNRYCD